MAHLTRRHVRSLIAIVVFVAFAAGCYLYVTGAYRRHAANELAQAIRRIEFKPAPDREFVIVEDASTIQSIRAWLLAARSPSVGSWPPATCPVIIHFANGSKTELSISSTGMMRTYIRELRDYDPARFQGVSYAVLEWNGHHRIGDDQPFTDFLRRAGRLAAENPNAVSMYSDDVGR